MFSALIRASRLPFDDIRWWNTILSSPRFDLPPPADATTAGAEIALNAPLARHENAVEMDNFDDEMDGLSLSSSSGSKHPRDSPKRKELTSEKVRNICGSFSRIFVLAATARERVIAPRRTDKGGLPVGCLSVVCAHWGLPW